MTEKQAIPLRFCKESNDLLHPQEDKKTKKLMYVCRNCDYTVCRAGQLDLLTPS